MDTEYKILISKSCYEILRINNLSHNFPAHIHRRTCAGRIDSGEKILFIDGKNYLLKKNDLFFIPPCTPHKCIVKDRRNVSYTILSFDDISNISGETIINDISSSGVEIDDIKPLIAYAIKIFTVHLNKYSSMIDMLIKYIDDNLAGELSTELLSELAGISPYHMLHVFKEKTGLSLRQYIIQARIRKARESLHVNKNPLMTGLDCGFYDQSHFIRHFKRHVGITPGTYIDSVKIM
jgi:AraC-like DNA-binding protein